MLNELLSMLISAHVGINVDVCERNDGVLIVHGSTIALCRTAALFERSGSLVTLTEKRGSVDSDKTDYKLFVRLVRCCGLSPLCRG